MILNKVRITLTNVFKSESKKTALFFSVSSSIKTIGSIIGGIIVIKWIDPEKIGLWQSLMIASPYVFIFQFGIMNGLNRELPFLMGSGKEEEANNLASSAQSYAFIIMGIVFVLGVGVCFFHWIINGFQPLFQFSLLGVTIIISLGFYHNYLAVTFRAEKAFKRLAKVYLIQFFVILLSLFFVYYQNYYGLIIYYVLCEISLTLLMHSVRPVVVKPKFNIIYLKKLVKVGLPIFSMGYLQQISKSFSRLLLIYSGGTISVGLYAPATAISNAIIMLPNILSQYMYPKMSFIYGKTKDTILLWNLVKKITISFLIISSIIAIPMWYIIPYIIEDFFPKYSNGILPAQLSLISVVFSGTMISTNSLYSIKAYKEMLIITITKLLAFFGFPFICIYFYEPLIGVALGNVFASILTFIISLWIMYVVLFKRARNNTNKSDLTLQ